MVAQCDPANGARHQKGGRQHTRARDDVKGLAMAKDKGSARPRAETPKGFRDYFGAEVSERKAMMRR